MPPQLLIITRNYPPQIGGLENYSFHLIRELKRHLPVRVIALGKSKPHLIWFLPLALAAGLASVWNGSTRRVHLCDGLLAPIGLVIKLFSRSRVSISVHGLDVIFSQPLYQRLIPFCLRHLDQTVCVSRSTRDECLKRGIPAGRCVVIPNGIPAEEFRVDRDRFELIPELEMSLGRPLAGRKILVTVGRLVKRKGVQWFVEEVLPRLGPKYLYIIVGTGPEREAIQEAVIRRNLQDQVALMGGRPDRYRNRLLHAADIFIMPNISIPGDVEGFGIAALEAGACGLPVIAADIQGIRDAVIDGVTGHLVREKDAGEFAEKIRAIKLDRNRIRTTITSRFDWKRIGRQYADVLRLSAPEVV
jgi:glycosyltransferase involved in cell wall biosynthesis